MSTEALPPVLACPGAGPRFLGDLLPVPEPANSVVKDDLLVVEGRTRIDYTHFSLSMSKSRRFARWVAWNIDGGTIRKLSRNGIPFIKDPQVPADAQIGNELYSSNRLDRGHIARRADLLWGPLSEAKKANKDSFFYTNMTPQHEGFNQSGAGGIWGRLEDAIFEEVDVLDFKVTVMGGPVFHADDRLYRNCKIPRDFWKVIYFRDSAGTPVKSHAYLLTQEDLLNHIEALDLDEFKVFEIPISQVENLTGLTLPKTGTPESLKSARKKMTRAPESASDSRVRQISSIREIVG